MKTIFSCQKALLLLSMYFAVDACQANPISSLFHEQLGSGYTHADHGVTLSIGNSSNTEITRMTVSYYPSDSTNCTGTAITAKAINGSFTFTSGHTYYLDATELYDLPAPTDITGTYYILVSLINLTTSASVSYCLTTGSPLCSDGQCISTTQNTAKSAFRWTASYPA